ncbi:dihydrolipoamide acetyltransferase family protein [Bacillus rubiinfantis]|uniref:dihydrolipoamide acetyltransferase family protein n=1 Tax=Bacillus rubiinfantis TaxID=1499680 RepID=UPI0005AA67F5|nr:dihydrolipoamide acetyltransferase family protein [Bacillus rubiinfantis]
MIEITIPKIGVEDGEVILTSWEKEEGAAVEKDEIIASVETEKVNSDILAPASGILKIMLQQGESARMTDTIGYIVSVSDKSPEEKEVTSKFQNPRKVHLYQEPQLVKEMKQQLSPAARRRQMKNPLETSASFKPERIIGSPAAKRIAKELGINLLKVSGSGPQGAILAKDVYEARKTQISQTDKKQQESIKVEAERKIRSKQPLSPIRKTIARNMFNSLQQTAQMTLMGSISLDKLWPIYQQMKDDLLPHSIKPSWAALFVKATALALEEHRHLNATYETDELIIWEDINIGVAVSTEKGLVVPPIRNANKKSLYLIHKEIKELAEKARQNQLTATDLSGSTFTLTNVGSYGGELGTPILNTKELGILGVGAVTKQAVVNEKDEIVVGRSCYYNLTVDHQMVDGEAAGKFIQTIKRMLNSPTLLLMS